MPTASTIVLTLVGVAVLVTIATAVLAAVRAPAPWAPALAVLRGTLQLAAIALVLSGVIRDPLWIAAALLVMTSVACWTAARRLGPWRTMLLPVAVAMTTGIVVSLGVVFATGTIAFTPRYVLALGGIVIGNAMTIATLSGRRFVELAGDRWEEVEGWLALGATPRRATTDIVRRAVHAAMVPTTDQTRTTGLVTLPGAFVGAVFGGVSPLEAGRFQIVVLAAIIAAGAVVAVMVTGWLAPVRTRPEPLGRRGSAADPLRSGSTTSPRESLLALPEKHVESLAPMEPREQSGVATTRARHTSSTRPPDPTTPRRTTGAGRRRAVPRIVDSIGVGIVGIVGGAALWSTVVVAGLALVRSRAVTVAETGIDRQVDSGAGTAWHGLADVIAVVLQPVAGCIVIAALAVLLRVAVGRSRAWGFVVVTAVPWLSTEVVKVVVDRARPDLGHGFPTAPPDSGSFPSGHTALAVALALGIGWLFVGRRRVLVTVIGLLLAGVVGASRIVLGVHYPTDVLASFVATTAVFLVVSGLLATVQLRHGGRATAAD